MKWYYAAAGVQVGPIDETELNRLVTMGAVRADTLVWHEGLAAWQPLGVVRGMAPGAAVVAGRHYAGFWIRFVAKFIDGIIMTVAGLILFIPVLLLFGGGVGLLSLGRRSIDGDGGALLGPAMLGVFGISRLVLLAVSVFYDAYFLSAHGATPGKMAMGLKVIRADGGPLSPMLAVARHFAEWVSAIIFMIGYIMAGFDAEKRALHDRICETRVVHAR
ncbi:MAG: RDD family protein [Acidobacteriota bacterium]|nr:RDD family protein [Acidobacteriota bacterium]